MISIEFRTGHDLTYNEFGAHCRLLHHSLRLVFWHYSLTAIDLSYHGAAVTRWLTRDRERPSEPTRHEQASVKLHASLQNPSREVNRRWSTQQIGHFLWKTEVHFRFHNSSLCDRPMKWTIPVNFSKPYLHPGLLSGLFPSGFSSRNVVCIFHAYHMSHRVNCNLFCYPNTIWWEMQHDEAPVSSYVLLPSP
jgi:hypothetical protein